MNVVRDNVWVVVILCVVGSSISMRTVTVGAEGNGIFVYAIKWCGRISYAMNLKFSL